MHHLLTTVMCFDAPADRCRAAPEFGHNSHLRCRCLRFFLVAPALLRRRRHRRPQCESRTCTRKPPRPTCGRCASNRVPSSASFSPATRKHRIGAVGMLLSPSDRVSTPMRRSAPSKATHTSASLCKSGWKSLALALALALAPSLPALRYKPVCRNAVDAMWCV